MTARRIPLQKVTRPRMANQTELAYYLGLSPNSLANKLAELYRAGMPKPDPILGLHDLAAVDRWLDGRRGRLDGRAGRGEAGEPDPDPDLDNRIDSYGAV